MIESWRWFGPHDPISLNDVRQTGATGIVTALHEIPNGTFWPEEEIAARRQMIEDAGLTWQVAESIPVHEDIKTGAPGWERWARNWAETANALARQGITTICYNFMPVLDWTRTDLDYCLEGGATALRFEFAAYAAFDLFILERDGAEVDYSSGDIAAAQSYLAACSHEDRDRLTANIIAGLPGSEESYTLDAFRDRLAAYRDIGREQHFQHLRNFLETVIPAVEDAGVVLALHPDDPPRPLFGLPRIASTLSDLERIASMNASPANGFTLCTGSLGVHPDNDLPAIVEAMGDRIHFAHLRATRREGDPRSFYEDAHLGGDIDMVAIIRALRRMEAGSGKRIPMRPDHGHRILNDLSGASTPGYPAIGRLKGLAELRGVIRAVDSIDNLRS
ncbi:mannonate dehydratase [Roseibium album]|uniref:Mannonate dehydratase n=1 Tax=Roseibium album TaxID=311410 RepID=A0A0M6ZMC4_9HYPH|nr:mannonate dehydratase [Roseibium album]CTQ62644.1 Mannonate dehydratase [Roseibium album]CTQ78996.1 Mannonate dehydratase [Roseibium album]CTQ80375.1 Mannonate dehydratase [Roseibium album]